MPWDAGTQVVSSASTAEPLTNDLNAAALVKAKTKIKSITVKAPDGNTGDVYFGRSTVSSSYGITLGQGDSWSLNFDDGSEEFGAFYVDAANSSDALEWSVIW